MIISKKALPRRTLLRGMGATVALPLLDAMVPAMTATASTPARPVRRLGYIFIPMGSDTSRWTPPGDDSLTELSPILQPLWRHRDHVTVVTNMELKNAYPGSHATSNSAYLSCAKAKIDRKHRLLSRHDCRSGSSQGNRSRHAASVSRARHGSAGYRGAMRRWLCLRVPEQSLLVLAHHSPSYEAHPQKVFARLFGEGSPEERSRTLKKKASMLDRVKSDISRLQRTLGSG